MIEVRGPVIIKTDAGTIILNVNNDDGSMVIETFQRNGKARYTFKNDSQQNGQLTKD